ncbi:hypothetical protein BC832DRAFT_548720 [Gaertneriomyces semiglobifer]|nr:hypothetical protein BC832DRAFT_548720 [Gaertneriomyces semiglobifer]
MIHANSRCRFIAAVCSGLNASSAEKISLVSIVQRPTKRREGSVRRLLIPRNLRTSSSARFLGLFSGESEQAANQSLRCFRVQLHGVTHIVICMLGQVGYPRDLHQ